MHLNHEDKIKTTISCLDHRYQTICCCSWRPEINQHSKLITRSSSRAIIESRNERTETQWRLLISSDCSIYTLALHRINLLSINREHEFLSQFDYCTSVSREISNCPPGRVLHTQTISKWLHFWPWNSSSTRSHRSFSAILIIDSTSSSSSLSAAKCSHHLFIRRRSERRQFCQLKSKRREIYRKIHYSFDSAPCFSLSLTNWDVYEHCKCSKLIFP